MNIKVVRKYFKDKYTIGDMFIDGKWFCNTLEDKNRDLNKNGKFDNGEKKVYGETCIPFGKYDVKVTYVAKFKRELPWLQNVPNFTGILIHNGVTHEHTLGCILVGENKERGKLLNGKKYDIELTKRCKESLKKGDKVIIEII